MRRIWLHLFGLVFVLSGLTVTSVRAEVKVSAGIDHQVARLGEPFSFDIPDAAFTGAVDHYQVEVLRRDLSGEVPPLLNDFWWQRGLSHHWLKFSGSNFYGTPDDYEDLQTLQLLVSAFGEDGSQAQASFLLVTVDGEGPLQAPATHLEDCAYIFDDGERGHIDAAELGLEPGDSLCLPGGVVTDGLTLENLQGTRARPIYVLNVGEPATTRAEGLSYTLQVSYSNHFKLLGVGSADNPYGWRIGGDTGPAVQIKFCYQDIEVAWLEIGNSGFAGVSIKNDGEQRPDGDMSDVRVHDLYIHHTGTKLETLEVPRSGEGMYSGIGSWSEGTHSIHRLRVHHLIGHDIAWDALQIKNNDDRDAVIERNFFRRYGLGDAGNTGAHDEGLFAGEGSTGVYRYNWIEDGFGPSGNGIQFYGAGESLFHHNVIVNLAPGSSGRFPVYGARDGYLPDAENQRVSFLHNTFVGFSGQGNSDELVRVFTDIGELHTQNNLFVESQGDRVGGDAGGNVIAQNRSIFRDPASRDLRPALDSPALASGVVQSRVSRDILGHLLPAVGITSGAFQDLGIIFRDGFEPTSP